MLELQMEQLLERLNYQQSPYHHAIQSKELFSSYIFRNAEKAGVSSVYLLQAVQNNQIPAVFVAEANNAEEAREIQRCLWNLNHAPLIIIKLPQEIRIYTGFCHTEDETKKQEELLDVANDHQSLERVLGYLSADSLNSGTIWESEYGRKININNRVDHHLLKNLKILGDFLKTELPFAIVHSLIGKYIYIYYLRHREIISDLWLSEQGIDPQFIFTHQATRTSLIQLTEALEKRFRGNIFPLDFAQLRDEDISLVASIFSGNEIISSAPSKIQQLHLPFQAYDFFYIPVETLSAIYEQFIDQRKEKGAVYTPEFLADYLLTEIETVKPLHVKGKLFDPACGSGIFLVLAYRRLIEQEMRISERLLSPNELKKILENCIYGLEREKDACYIAEFSLILTLLNYLNPPDLAKNTEFHFPELHNKQIFHADFFDPNSEFQKQRFAFDWIIGNPPWTSKGLDPEIDRFSLQWLKEETKNYPVGQKQIAEAFSWRSARYLLTTGVIGFILPATTLFNSASQHYRRRFFTKYEVLRITNFSNLRENLFGKGKESILPAMTLVYRPNPTEKSYEIIHYAPKIVDQISDKQPWMISIYGNDITTVNSDDVEGGDSLPWKVALWGNWFDKTILRRIQANFRTNLQSICEEYGGACYQGAELKDKNQTKDVLLGVPELLTQKKLDPKKINSSFLLYSLDKQFLEPIVESEAYLRKRGGAKGFSEVSYAPHILVSLVWQSYLIYSEEDFVIPQKNVGIALPDTVENRKILQTLTLYLSSTIVAYHLFFHVPEWGVFRNANRITKRALEKLPVPQFSAEQIDRSAQFHQIIVADEKELIEELLYRYHVKTPELMGLNNDQEQKELFFDFDQLTPQAKKRFKDELADVRQLLQKKIDNFFFELFGFPQQIRAVFEDFAYIRLSLDKTARHYQVTRKPTQSELVAYACQLKNQFDQFAKGDFFHRISVEISADLITCTIEMIDHDEPFSEIENVRKTGNTRQELLNQLSTQLQRKFSQWVYIQRNLRLYEGKRIYLYKPARLIDWTRTQAILDASDLIGEILRQREP